jgi:hypothetical protein
MNTSCTESRAFERDCTAEYKRRAVDYALASLKAPPPKLSLARRLWPWIIAVLIPAVAGLMERWG